jgi:pimeloyl-ACP methyl ester carboxylesterase
MKFLKIVFRVFAVLFAFIIILIFVVPLLISIPPLENTVDPKHLADEDSQFVTVDGISIHYKQHGDEGQDLILMHGLGASVYSWQRVREDLSDFGTVTAYDRPAFGLTERIMPEDYNGRNPYSRNYQPQFLVEFMNQVDIQTAVLVGNSAGGTLAVQMALEYPERVEALILVDPALLTSGGPPSFLYPFLKLPSIDRVGVLFARYGGSMTETFLRRAYYDTSKITPEIVEGYQKPLRADHWDRAFWEFVKAAEPIDLASRLAEIDLPVLVITGNKDRIVPAEQSIRVAGMIRNAELVVIPECGHAPQEECPDAFMDAVENFLINLDTLGDHD